MECSFVNPTGPGSSIGPNPESNFLGGPAAPNFDIAFLTEFAVRTKVRFQFRVDDFNIFNHTECSGYNANTEL